MIKLIDVIINTSKHECIRIESHFGGDRGRKRCEYIQSQARNASMRYCGNAPRCEYRCALYTPSPWNVRPTWLHSTTVATFM